MHTNDILHGINFVLLIPLTYLCRFLLILIILMLSRRWYLKGKKKFHATVVVLGDIGRSPRMQYHALSLAKHGFQIDMVGYPDSTPHHRVIQNENIQLHFLSKESISAFFPKLLSYFVKVVLQSLILAWKLLVNVHGAEYILIQNPPCIPTMLVCWMVSVFNGTKLVIDWHNYGYTILALTLGMNHKLVKIAHWYEKILGQLASTDMCVTKAMQKDLEDNWHIHAVVVYDRPPDEFKPLNEEEQHTLFMRLKQEYNVFKAKIDTEWSTVFTVLKDKVVTKYMDRPAFLISSTSWTEDEDFSILLNALKMYDMTKLLGRNNLPDFICAITGKGPMKDFYMTQIQKANMKHVKIITPWLTAEDYPMLIGSADLGICLHTSSSGLDLPMKVVDMFGCGVPVAAVRFNCLSELVLHEVNGVIFQNENELHDELCNIFDGFPKKQTRLSAMRKNLSSFRDSTWSKNWDENVLPLFKT